MAALVCLPATAQELPFTHFTPNDQVTPLSSASVQKIVQDHLGYIWFAFYSTGLTRYDGHTMEDYGTTDGLDDLTVREIVEDDGHRLWVGSESGIVVSEKPLEAYEPGGRVRFVDSVGGVPLPRTRIRHNCVVAGAGGWIWIGGQNGLRRLRVRNNRLERADSISSPILAMLARRNGDLIVSLTDGTNLIFDSEGHIRGRIDAPGRVPVGALAETRDGRVWGGSNRGEVWVLQDGGAPAIVSRDIPERISWLTETSRGDLWVASLGAGAERISLAHPEERLIVRRSSGLLGDTIWSQLEDREGNLWFAQNGGASRLRRDYDAFQAWTGRTTAGGTPLLPDPSAFAALPPGGSGPFAKYTWVGTGGGLVGIAGNRREVLLGAADGLLNNSVYALGRDDDGRIWIGDVGGVNCLSTAKNQPPALDRMTRTTIRVGGTSAVLTSYPFDITYDARQYEMAPAGPGMWFAGIHGVSCVAGGKWYLFGPASGIPPTGATSVAVDDDGFVWVGTADNGLYRSIAPFHAIGVEKMMGADRQSAERFFAPIWNRSNGAPSDSVRTLLWYDQHLWAGTSDGLVVLSTVPFAALAKLPGRAIGGSLVVGMAPSPVTGNVWVSQNDGLVEIEKRTFRIVSRVSKADGLLNDEAWAYGPVGVGADGRIYLATPSGVSLYDPAKRRLNTTPPIVRFRHIESTEDWLGNNEISIEYAALAFSDEGGVRYRTRMIGYDRDWSSEHHDPRIRYTNLPAWFFPRDYKFAVTARNGDGTWSPVAITYDFSVLPAIWLRWWAFLGYVGFIVLAGWTIQRLRTRQLQRRNRALEDLVLARTEEIRTQAHELETIDTIVEIINRELAVENVLQSILEQGMRLLPQAQKAAFLQLDHERNRSDVVAVSGWDAKLFENVGLTPDEAVRRYSENAEEIEEGVFITREEAFPRLAGNEKTRQVPPSKIMLAMAVTIAGRIEGFFVFDNFTDANAFSKSDLHKVGRLREHAISAITKARTLRQLELKSREAEEANRAKSQFLANMSHELRTPMNAIIGFSEVLTERLEPTVDAKSIGFLRSILNSGRHLLEIINDILDLSKVEAGKMEIFPELFSVPAAIESVCQVMRGFAARSGITFAIDIAPDVSDIETDQAKFKQILYNLLSNAVKFSPSDSLVTIRARRLGESIEIQVIDRGIGIAREHLDVIWDEFRQIDATTARRFGGTGLGLSLVRKFVELQNGTVAVESSVGMGSVFTVTLPRRFAGAKIPSPIVSADGTVVPPGKRVLVVESDDAAFSTLSTYLRAAAFVPIRARRADEALRLARTMKPVAIALDVVLAGSDGWDVLRRLKAEDDTSAIPAVVISADNNRDLGISLGAAAHFTKPLDWSQLIRRMRELTRAA